MDNNEQHAISSPELTSQGSLFSESCITWGSGLKVFGFGGQRVVMSTSAPYLCNASDHQSKDLMIPWICHCYSVTTHTQLSYMQSLHGTFQEPNIKIRCMKEKIIKKSLSMAFISIQQRARIFTFLSCRMNHS